MRALILAYDFPPYVSVGGLRPYSWYRYLKESGVEPIVVTRQWANEFGDERDYIAPSATDTVQVEQSESGTIIRTPFRPNLSNRLLLRHGSGRHRLLRKAVTAWYEVVQYYADVGPRAPLVEAARGYLRSHRVDAIVATGNPYVLFRFASELSREFGIPWVADYRDPWSQDKRRHLCRASLWWNRALERKLVASASAVTTANDAFRHVLAGLHTGKSVVVIPNGYDPEAMAAAHGVAPDPDHLRLAYTGSTYLWHPIESVFRELDAFVRTDPSPPLLLDMVGVGDRGALESLLARSFPALARRTEFTRRLANDEMARRLAGAHALLVFNNYAYPGTKIYDCLALRRRILLCYSEDAEAERLRREHYNIDVSDDDDVHAHERMVEAAAAGTVVRDAAHLRETLAALHRELVETGTVSCDSRNIEQYSRRAGAGRLAALLREIVR